MSKIKLLVSIDDEHLEQILDVIQDLQAAGMQVDQIMDKLGIVTGSCDSTKVDALSQVAGVLEVEPEQGYQIAPPDSDIQ
ncbi:MAG: ketohydroxyglutarate aldolase [Cyanothece sp. SIO1E1]|nr:ketohydroxyglutarate aldolase [Cyanothece sp. SIO1E1]